MSRRKIICTVTNDLTHDRRMHRICTTLSGAGFEVELVGRRLPHSQPLPRRAFRQVRLRCFFHRGKLFYLEYNLRLFLYLMPRRAGALCAVDLDTLCAGWLVARLRGWKLVYDAHEFFQEVPEVVGRPFTQRVWEGVARALIPRVDAAYTVSTSLAAELSKRYGVSFGLVRNLPPRPALPTHADKHHPPALLYQGVLNEGRGLEEAIEAMRLLDGVELWLAGEGDLSEALRRRVARLQLGGKVKFLGYVPPEDLPTLTRRATLGLNLLKNKGLNYYFSLGNKTFDYIHAGIPALAMDFPEYRALQATYEVQVLLAELTPEVIADAARRLLNDPAHYHRLVENCRRAARELCWENEKFRLLEIWEPLLE